MKPVVLRNESDVARIVDSIPGPLDWRDATGTFFALTGAYCVAEYILIEIFGAKTYEDLDVLAGNQFHTIMLGYIATHWNYIQPEAVVRTNTVVLPKWVVYDHQGGYRCVPRLTELTTENANDGVSQLFFAIAIKFLQAYMMCPCSGEPWE